MTPQAILKARFGELAELQGVDLRVTRQKTHFYFVITGEWNATQRLRQGSFPKAGMTSAATQESIYGLPDDDVEKVLAKCQIDPTWLTQNDAVVQNMAEHIREKNLYGNLPILADALEEAGCENQEILKHCRENGEHKTTCWVVDLLLGPRRARRRVG
jgi:hypothetical protein